MAKLAIKPENQKQSLLFPPCLDELIPETHMVRVVNEIIDRLDTSCLKESYKGGGNSCYSPRMMLKLLVYSYLNNVYSSRKIEQQIRENINYMWLSGMSRPDFRTLNYFRGKRLKSKFESIFIQVVELLHSEGFLTLDVQYIDGTKIESAANKYTFVWRKSIEKYDARLKAKTTAILERIEQSNGLESEENPVNTSVTPEQFRERVENIRQKVEQDKLSKEDKKALREIEHEKLPKMDKYALDLSIMGNRNSYSKTDPEATFMRMKEDAMLNGQLKAGYNVQISTENQFITNYGIYQRPGDTLTLISYLETFKSRYGEQSSVIVADSGYGSEQNYEYMFGENLMPYVKYNMFHKEQKRKYKNNPYLQANMYYNREQDYYVCPMGQHLEFIRQERRISESGYESTLSLYRARRCSGCPLRGGCHKSKRNRQMEVNHNLNALKQTACDLLMSQAGMEHRSKRPIEPEAVFGHIKECGMFRRFRLRGIAGASLEFGLKALAHNLKKLAALTWAKLFACLFFPPKWMFTTKWNIVYNLRLPKVA